MTRRRLSIDGRACRLSSVNKLEGSPRERCGQALYRAAGIQVGGWGFSRCLEGFWPRSHMTSWHTFRRRELGVCWQAPTCNPVVVWDGPQHPGPRSDPQRGPRANGAQSCPHTAFGNTADAMCLSLVFFTLRKHHKPMVDYWKTVENVRLSVSNPTARRNLLAPSLPPWFLPSACF